MKGKMYSRFRLAQKYLHYYLVASNGKGHGTHSPFVFDFITHVLNDGRPYAGYAQIEELRRQLLRDERVLEVDDLGAGSHVEVTGSHHEGRAESMRRRKVADIARHAAKPRKLGQLLFRIARHYQPGSMLELGTSLGLSAAYLATGSGREVKGSSGGEEAEGKGESVTRLLTIEGSAAVAKVAEANLRSLGLGPEAGLKNIQVIVGDFDQALPGVLERIGRIDLAFVDGNHRREPTLRYFNMLMERVSPSAVLIFDDIHWSAEMEQAWEEIKCDPRVLLTVDLFFIGLVFFREQFKVKQDFIIRF